MGIGDSGVQSQRADQQGILYSARAFRKELLLLVKEASHTDCRRSTGAGTPGRIFGTVRGTACSISWGGANASGAGRYGCGIGGVIVGGSGAAGEDVHAFFLAVPDQVRVHARGDDELGARRQGFVDLRRGQDGACAHDHVRRSFLHEPDGIRSACRPEGHLGHRYAAGAQGLGQGGGVPLGMVQLDHRHHAGLGDGDL